MAALRGEAVDMPPVMLHNFMMAAHENGVSMADFRRDAQLAAQSFINAVEKYHYDAILMDIDTATLAGAVGAKVDFPDDEPARVVSGVLATMESVNDLKPVDLSADMRIQVWLETVSRLVDHFGQEIAIRGNCDQAPFSLAALVRSTDAWLMDLTDQEKKPYAEQLLEYCVQITTQFIQLMAEAGAHIVSNGDSIGGPDMVSPRFYRKYVLPYEQRVSKAANDLGMPYILHICGNTTKILPDMMNSGAQGLEIDYKTDIQVAHNLLKDHVTLIGTLDPVSVVSQGSKELVVQKSEELLQLFSDTPRFILNAGCAIPPETPSENIRAMIQAARNFSE
jgi:uroporphyrinogen decarboxylase